MSLTCISIFHIGATTAKESDETHNAIVRRSGYIIPPEREREARRCRVVHDHTPSLDGAHLFRTIVSSLLE